MHEPKKTLTEFGVKVKIKLLELGKNQNWLIDEVKKRNPTTYMDSSLMNKILTGQVKSGKNVDSIKEILNL